MFDGDIFLYEEPTFEPIKRSNKFGKGTNHLFDIEEYYGNNCFIPTASNCFNQCINYLTGKDYKYIRIF